MMAGVVVAVAVAVAVAESGRSEWGCLQTSVPGGRDVFVAELKDATERSW